MSTAAHPKRVYYPMVLFRKLYDWVIHWGNTRHAPKALFLISLAEASFFPIPPDVLLMTMSVSQPKHSLRFASITLAGSIIGALVGYGIGFAMWSLVDQFFFTYVVGFTPDLFQQISDLYKEHAFWTVFTAGFTPIPYKLFTVAAGVTQIDLAPFLIASILSRGLRFFLIGGLLKYFGRPIKEFIENYFDIASILFMILLIGGFVAVKYLL